MTTTDFPNDPVGLYSCSFCHYANAWTRCHACYAPTCLGCIDASTGLCHACLSMACGIYEQEFGTEPPDKARAERAQQVYIAFWSARAYLDPRTRRKL